MSLKEVFQNNPERRYIMFGGKGGLERRPSLLPLPTGWHRRARKCWSFQWIRRPAFPIFSRRTFSARARCRSWKICGRRRSTPTSHIKDYQNEIRKKILDMYGFDEVPEEIEHYIQACSAEPAMEESAIFDAVVDIVVKAITITTSTTSSRSVTRCTT